MFLADLLRLLKRKDCCSTIAIMDSWSSIAILHNTLLMQCNILQEINLNKLRGTSIFHRGLLTVTLMDLAGQNLEVFFTLWRAPQWLT